MQGLDQILGSSGMDLAGLAAKFGIPPEQASAAMGSLLPAVLGGLQKKADAGDLGGVDTVATQIDQPDTASGNDVLGHIFGDKDVSRQVADHASGESGVPATILKAMLPVVAAMVAKHLAGNSGGASDAGSGVGGGLGGLIGSVLGGGGGGQSGGLGGLGGLAGMFGGGGGANPLDAILARAR